MKLESLSIRDFRGIESLDLSFKDELDLIRDCVPIVGPNTSGKTSILEAIALCLVPITWRHQPHEILRTNPAALIRSGSVRTSVSAAVWFSNDEIDATREVLHRTGNLGKYPVPTGNHLAIHWTFPDPEGRFPLGTYRFEPGNNLLLTLGRSVLASHRHVPGLDSRLFRRLGTVVLFDQQRIGLAKALPVQEKQQIGHLLDPDQSLGGNGHSSVEPGIHRPSDGAGYASTPDPRVILTSLAMRAQVAQEAGVTEKEDFARLKQLYERVCRPHKIGDLYNTEHGLDIEFCGDRGRYYYDGLSSGQQMILLMLLQFATRRIHRSIVLIDELELHLHPLWQSRLYNALPDLGDDNQYILTTHSTHLRDTIGEPSYHTTGDLSGAATVG